MDDIDRKICDLIQKNGRVPTSAIAEAVGLPVSTANDRIHRLEKSGVIVGWRAQLDPGKVGAGICAFLLIEMHYEGEAEAAAAIAARDEVMEIHHISGAHSYLVKLRIPDMAAMQGFLTDVVKPLGAVARTETIFALETLKETGALKIAAAPEDGTS